jgi:hypothetical protein
MEEEGESMDGAVVEAIATGSFATNQQQSTPVVSLILRHLKDVTEAKQGAVPAALALLKELSGDTRGAHALLDVSINGRTPPPACPPSPRETPEIALLATSH